MPETLFSDPDSPTAILWDESGSLELRAATKAKLIEKLCHEVYYGATSAVFCAHGSDPAYVTDFLLTFPYFMKPEDVVHWINLWCVPSAGLCSPNQLESRQ